MDPAALLKTLIYLIAASLLYPVLFALVFLAVYVLLTFGTCFAEWLERVRLRKCPPAELPDRIRQGACENTFPHRVQTFLASLDTLLTEKGHRADLEIENLIQQTRLDIWKRMDRLRIMVRTAPALGLIGTLIPMGTGLAALGQGDMTKLSSDLVIAFTTTVVGLAVGISAFCLYTFRRRWVEEDIKNMELATDILVDAAELPREPCEPAEAAAGRRNDRT